ncbi:hypothetical protein RRF57_005383 [Xylaria bambusicola]|uniref:Uncharacterized protein n=1 Tax=Xylaria bambusicola TaxID=326684 RepID=A0AAN7UHT7_9PEZI
MVRTEYPTRASLEKFVVSRQDSIGSDTTPENKVSLTSFQPYNASLAHITIGLFEIRVLSLVQENQE